MRTLHEKSKTRRQNHAGILTGLFVGQSLPMPALAQPGLVLRPPLQVPPQVLQARVPRQAVLVLQVVSELQGLVVPQLVLVPQVMVVPPLVQIPQALVVHPVV